MDWERLAAVDVFQLERNESLLDLLYTFLEKNELSAAEAARAEPGQLAKTLSVVQRIMKVKGEEAKVAMEELLAQQQAGHSLEGGAPNERSLMNQIVQLERDVREKDRVIEGLKERGNSPTPGAVNEARVLRQENEDLRLSVLRCARTEVHALPRKPVPVSLDTLVLCVSRMWMNVPLLTTCALITSRSVNTIGGHFCRCSAGYQGNGTFCEDINECETDIHNCVRRGSGSCVNTEGSFMCLCDNMMDCTGACKRCRVEYAHRESFIDSRDECSNCTCLNGEIFCHTRNCDGDCSDRIIHKCCVKCASRDCYLNLEGVSEPVKIRPDSVFVHPMDPCTKWTCTCSSDLDLTHENVSSECPPLNCGEEFQVRQPGRCCRICLLPPCSSDMAGVTLPLHNGCKQCTCEAGSWNCHDRVTCPSSNCAYEDILFYNDQCCPVCESDLVGSTCRNFARNKSLFP